MSEIKFLLPLVFCGSVCWLWAWAVAMLRFPMGIGTILFGAGCLYVALSVKPWEDLEDVA